MQDTHNIDRLGATLVDLIGFLNSPRRDDALLREAGVDLDRALFPLLVVLGALGPLPVAELADWAGRDHTTISRQLAKLESLGLVERLKNQTDRRIRAAAATRDGMAVARAVTAARRRLLSEALADWSEADRTALADLIRRFVESLKGLAERRG